ncbi:MAG: site-specific DNA-methyltransferase [Rhodospirillales bacterium]|nr:site-specific DNA-methyltransferase [Rhodospirillales bacterium]
MARPNWKNRTFFPGDNLGFLEAMNSESVDLIATDPPFNKGRDFRATPDSLAAGAKFQDRWSWEQDVHQDWVDQITDSHPRLMRVIAAARDSYSDGMGAFLCFMAMRLLAMRRILKPTGSVYLHCDPTASHYLKQLMDAVFGRRNFKNEVVWCYKSGGASKRRFAKKHDIILFYAKVEKLSRFNVLKIKSYGRTGGGQGGAVKYFRDGQGTYSIVSARDWWDMSMLSTTHGERLGYPTQKPIALYERMILASSDEGDVVLDPFAGCATTLVAAERLKRQWVGIDIWGNARSVVLQRLGREGLLGEGTTGQRRLFANEVTFTTDLPERTDGDRSVTPPPPSRPSRLV